MFEIYSSSWLSALGFGLCFKNTSVKINTIFVSGDPAWSETDGPLKVLFFYLKRKKNIRQPDLWSFSAFIEKLQMKIISKTISRGDQAPLRQLGVFHEFYLFTQGNGISRGSCLDLMSQMSSITYFSKKQKFPRVKRYFWFSDVGDHWSALTPRALV